jgi:hypothetical protein
LALESRGELAYGDGNENKEDQVDDFLRILDAEAVERRVERKRPRRARRKSPQQPPVRFPTGLPR